MLACVLVAGLFGTVGATPERPILKQPLALLTNVVNNTSHDAWVDVSWSYPAQPWHIESAFCLRPRESKNHVETYHVGSFVPQVRVRAEVKRGDCRSATITTVSWDKDLQEDFRNAKAFYDVFIREYGNRYGVVASRR
jgi:hypothetical protein